MTYKRNIIATSLSAILLLGVLVVYAQGGWTKPDALVYAFTQKYLAINTTSAMVSLTILGSWMAQAIIVAIQLIWDKRKGVVLLANMGLIYGLNFLLKIIIHRPRPDVVHLVIEHGYGFPSVYAMTSMALFAYLIVYCFKQHKPRAVFFFLLTLIIGITRIYLGVHYFSDILAGHAFALFELSLLFFVIKYAKIEHAKKKKNTCSRSSAG